MSRLDNLIEWVAGQHSVDPKVARDIACQTIDLVTDQTHGSEFLLGSFHDPRLASAVLAAVPDVKLVWGGDRAFRAYPNNFLPDEDAAPLAEKVQAALRAARAALGVEDV